MKQLEDKIIKEGKVFPGDILYVGNFLNQQMDVQFLTKMGMEIAQLYSDTKITKVLTVEASGIALAVTAAQALGVNAVFAKKNSAANIDENVYSASVYSYTHKVENRICVSRDFLCSDDSVLIVDDFLAKGEALNGLIDLCRQAHAEVTGCAVAIEKGFQSGGDYIRNSGIRVESLAIIDSMSDNSLSFR